MPTYYINHRQKFTLRGTTRPRSIFLAEGDAEAFFLDQFLASQAAASALNIVVCFKGLGNVSGLLHTLVQEPNFNNVEAIGVFLDAEHSFAARAASVQAHLENVKLLPIAGPSPVGAVVTHAGRRIAVFISPGNGGQGAIDHLVLNEIQGKPEWGCLNGFIGCLQQNHAWVMDPKAVAQTYVSIKKPGLAGTGNAFDAGVLDCTAPAYAAVRGVFGPLIA